MEHTTEGTGNMIAETKVQSWKLLETFISSCQSFEFFKI